MDTAIKGDWVQIKSIELHKGQRAPQVPQDTQKCDLVKWVKGFLIDKAKIGEQVEIITITGRREKGELYAVKPAYSHSFGRHVPELLQVQRQLQTFLSKGGEQ